ncbi:MAG: response regulator, partial [Fibrobacterales bacterium]
MHILVVDDDPINREVIGAQLGELQHSFKDAVNGKMALKMVEKFDFDIILSDIEMPVMDGLALIKEIRTLPSPKNALPVVAITAADSEFDQLLEAGFDNCLGKPIDKATLERILLEPKSVQEFNINDDQSAPSSNQVLDTEFLMNNYGDTTMITKLLKRYLQADAEEWATLMPA